MPLQTGAAAAVGKAFPWGTPRCCTTLMHVQTTHLQPCAPLRWMLGSPTSPGRDFGICGCEGGHAMWRVAGPAPRQGQHLDDSIFTLCALCLCYGLWPCWPSQHLPCEDRDDGNQLGSQRRCARGATSASAAGRASGVIWGSRGHRWLGDAG